MNLRRWVYVGVAVVALAAAGGWGLAPAAAPSVVFEVGGDASAAANSAHASWGQPVQVSSGSSWIEAAGDQQVMCRILVGSKLVAEAHAAGKGQRAFCAFG